jgi:hypothetical protein
MACMHPCLVAFAQRHKAQWPVRWRGQKKKPRRNNLPLVTRAHFSTQLHSVKLNTFAQSAKLNNKSLNHKFFFFGDRRAPRWLLALFMTWRRTLIMPQHWYLLFTFFFLCSGEFKIFSLRFIAGTAATLPTVLVIPSRVKNWKWWLLLGCWFMISQLRGCLDAKILEFG